MYSIGIVGSEEAKFTDGTCRHAHLVILEILQALRDKHGNYGVTVVSGGCHLGGIDIWAIDIARELGLHTSEFAPAYRGWDAYKRRNIKIAEMSDKVVCITVSEYPPGYDGMRFDFCYHCKTAEHIKSGGCWTMKYAAEKLGKETQLIVI